MPTNDRQTYKKERENIFPLTFSPFNKLSNLRSNKDKHSTHESVPETSLLCFYFTRTSFHFAYHNKQRKIIGKYFFFRRLLGIWIKGHFICNQLDISKLIRYTELTGVDSACRMSIKLSHKGMVLIKIGIDA